MIIPCDFLEENAFSTSLRFRPKNRQPLQPQILRAGSNINRKYSHNISTF